MTSGTLNSQESELEEADVPEELPPPWAPPWPSWELLQQQAQVRVGALPSLLALLLEVEAEVAQQLGMKERAQRGLSSCTLIDGPLKHT